MSKFEEDPSVSLARFKFRSALFETDTQRRFQRFESNESDKTEPPRDDGRRRNTPRGKMKAVEAATGRINKTFVVRLFDRSVDLAPFTESTPLYPVCRAWMQNLSCPRDDSKSGKDPLGEVEDKDDDETTKSKDPNKVYRLPPPIPLPRDEKGNPLSLRVPPPLAREKDEFVISSGDDEFAPSPTDLFRNHMARWKQINRRWKDAAKYNDQRYEESFSILRQIHKQSSSNSNSK